MRQDLSDFVRVLYYSIIRQDGKKKLTDKEDKKRVKWKRSDKKRLHKIGNVFLPKDLFN